MANCLVQRAICLTWKFTYKCLKGISKCLTFTFIVIVFKITCVCFSCDFQDGILTELFRCGVITLKRFGIKYTVQQKCVLYFCCSHFICAFRTSKSVYCQNGLQLNQNDIKKFWMNLWAKIGDTFTFVIHLYFFLYK